MTENTHYCVYDDCKSIATENTIEGHPVRCPIHKMDDKLYQKTLSYIKRFREVHGEQYTYFKTYYIHNREKIIITCQDHGDFQTRVDIHLQGSVCKQCANIQQANKRRKTTEQFIEDAKKVHGDKYNYEKVVYEKCDKHVIIICPTHGEFKQTPELHLSGNNCKGCGIIIGSTNQKMTTDDFIRRSKEIHGDKYNYDKVVYTDYYKPVIIYCKNHDYFEQKPANHLHGKGCLKCALDRQRISQLKPFQQFIDESKSVHGDKYDYSHVEYKNTSTPVKIICKIHGLFNQAPECHIRGQGCIECSIITRAMKQRNTTEEFIQKSRLIHGDTYDYSNSVYTTKNDYITIGCKKHGLFKQNAYSHTVGTGCPRCSYKGYSKGQIDWLDTIMKNITIDIQHIKNDVEHRIGLTKKHADGYSKKYHTIFEFHGCYYHGCPKCFANRNKISKFKNKTMEEIFQKTLKREQECRDLGYNLITIWECDWNDLKKSPESLDEYMTALKEQLNKYQSAAI
jgi:G:T-mismatch repair DNA endonuclease (very short patch repair protein)